ncbi:MAG: type III-B CRISPR module RAMP protein Cmr4 [Deltaproteobacteria bacterium]|nr:type III-B CRISPR module RAMP protein Cmr4 [Deltaproteobacteria bacterium]
MLKKELCSICRFYAVSPIHAGSGASTSAVDLPIQRERHTNYPHIQASGIKGAFRAHFRQFCDKSNDIQLINLLFGSDKQDGWGNDIDSLPGAMSVSDARLLAFPMRSNIAPFVWVTCPYILKRLQTDLEYIGMEMITDEYEIKNDNAFNIGEENLNGDVIIEDAVVNVKNGIKDKAFIKEYFSELKRLILISDEMFDYAISSCTEIQTNIKISSKTGTAEEGALRYQEFLPADSILYAIVHYSGRNLGEIKNDDKQNLLADLVKDMNAEMIKNHVEDTVKGFIQIGGDETLGKGICKLDWNLGGAK